MNTKSFIVLAVLYFIAAFADIYFIHFQPELRLFSKPLLLILLSVLFYLNAKGDYDVFAKFIQGALFFSWTGDLALMFTLKGELFFIAGLVSFLIAHIFYILSFIHIFRNRYQEIASIKIIIVTAVFLFYSMYVFSLLQPFLGTMLLPVCIYMLAITTMAILAGLNSLKFKTETFAILLGGAVLFVISDTLLAFDKFVNQTSLYSIAIMSTYILAQFLIVFGSLRYIHNEK